MKEKTGHSRTCVLPCPAFACKNPEGGVKSGAKRPLPDCWVYVRQYCAKIDEAARNRMELIVPELAKRNGVTEKLKADTKWNGYGR